MEYVCKYCGKVCKNKNSLAQHECRCKLNPDRKSFNNLSNYIKDNIKGKTKETSEVIAKQSKSLKQKYASGYINPNKGSHLIITSENEEHNSMEILKWLGYVKSLKLTLPKYETIFHNQGYKVISKMWSKDGSTIKLTFEHDYLANMLLGGTLQSENTVHHIDRDRSNNSLNNLMVFKSSDAHKRFHFSKKSYLIYDEVTHLFDCINR